MFLCLHHLRIIINPEAFILKKGLKYLYSLNTSPGDVLVVGLLLSSHSLLLGTCVVFLNFKLPQYKDLLQLMMEASVEEEQGATVEATEKKLTDKEIVAYSISFLLAGYETTSNTLAYISYLLALNPAVQKQLQTEIDEYFSDNPVTKHITQSHCEVIVLCTALGSGRSCIRIVFMFPLHS